MVVFGFEVGWLLNRDVRENLELELKEKEWRQIMRGRDITYIQCSPRVLAKEDQTSGENEVMISPKETGLT